MWNIFHHSSRHTRSFTHIEHDHCCRISACKLVTVAAYNLTVAVPVRKGKNLFAIFHRTRAYNGHRHTRVIAPATQKPIVLLNLIERREDKRTMKRIVSIECLILLKRYFGIVQMENILNKNRVWTFSFDSLRIHSVWRLAPGLSRWFHRKVIEYGLRAQTIDRDREKQQQISWWF